MAIAIPSNINCCSNQYIFIYIFNQLKALLNASAAPWPVAPCAAVAALVQASMVALGALHLSLSCWPGTKVLN